MKRHVQSNYYVVGEGVWSFDGDVRPRCTTPAERAEVRMFRYSRLGPRAEQADAAVQVAVNRRLARAMTAAGARPDAAADPVATTPVPAGFTYLGQFVDHDLTLDVTGAALGTEVTVEELVSARSPALDLDSVYGRGPRHPRDRRFYASDGVKLKVGSTAAVDLSVLPPPDPTNPHPPQSTSTNTARTGFDLPRVGAGPTKAAQRVALIPDPRNDENLALAQTHLAFIHFHNRVVDTLADRGLSGTLLFERARGEVVRHYQWLLRTDHLPRLVDPDLVDEVFTHGRGYVDPSRRAGPERGPAPGPATTASCPGGTDAGDTMTMPIEFSVAAYRLGHSMIRDTYQWNRLFNSGPTGRLGIATLFQLFTFSGTSGNLTPTDPANAAALEDPDSGTFLRLPTNWIVDWRRLHDFSGTALPDPVPPDGLCNVAKRIDTRLVNPLDRLPAGTFGGDQGLGTDDIQRNLAFRNLTRAAMVRLASGQQMAELFAAKALTRSEILTGDGTGADLTTGLSPDQQDAVASSTPLWFYILREAELGGGRLGAVGGRIVAEVFHRAMEVSAHSIIREPDWRPSFGPDRDTFRMADLLLFAFNDDLAGINPLGDS